MGKYLLLIYIKKFILNYKYQDCKLYGHYEGEVWGCASSQKPGDYRYVSSGGDKVQRNIRNNFINIFNI